MTLQEIEARKAELLNKIAEAKTQEEIQELRGEVEAINKEVPEQEETKQEDGEISHEEERSEEENTMAAVYWHCDVYAYWCCLRIFNGHVCGYELC